MERSYLNTSNKYSHMGKLGRKYLIEYQWLINWETVWAVNFKLMFEQDQKGTFRCQTCFGCDGLLKGWTDARQSQKKREKWEKRKEIQAPYKQHCWTIKAWNGCSNDEQRNTCYKLKPKKAKGDEKMYKYERTANSFSDSFIRQTFIENF